MQRIGTEFLSHRGLSIHPCSPFDELRVSGKTSARSNRDPLVLSSSKHERGENRQSHLERPGERMGEVM
jgi:hypothetical protein